MWGGALGDQPKTKTQQILAGHLPGFLSPPPNARWHFFLQPLLPPKKTQLRWHRFRPLLELHPVVCRAPGLFFPISSWKKLRLARDRVQPTTPKLPASHQSKNCFSPNALNHFLKTSSATNHNHQTTQTLRNWRSKPQLPPTRLLPPHSAASDWKSLTKSPFSGFCWTNHQNVQLPNG